LLEETVEISSEVPRISPLVSSRPEQPENKSRAKSGSR
jgi:hypothetical protein